MGKFWSDGAAYEPYVGRWSRLVAARFIDWLDAPTGSRWVDVGCGTGAVTQTILAQAQPSAVVGIDPSEGFVSFAAAQITDDRARFAVGDATALDLDDASVDVAVSGLVLNFVPDHAAAALEMARVTRPGGQVGAYVWDYAGQMQLMRRVWDAAGEVDPVARELDEGARFPVCQPGPLGDLFISAGLADVVVTPIDVPTTFRDFDDYWTPFLHAKAPAPGYVQSLTEDRRVALRERVRERLPFAEDGSISLIARAWAVRGRRP